jgi:hypothetical protein
MLFDMQDYRAAGVIGTNQIPISQSTWMDMGTTARATREAFFKAVDEWYLAATICPEGTCVVTPQSLYAEYLAEKAKFIITQDELWAKLGDGTPVTRTEYDNYVLALKRIMKTIKNLFAVTEGDRFRKA